jgi:hypothetical protein
MENFMKEILSSQLDMVSGGWADRDGSGRQGPSNNGRGNTNSNSGNAGDHGPQSFVSRGDFPYGSGSGANGFFGSSPNYGGGTSPNGYNANARHSGDNH